MNGTYLQIEGTRTVHRIEVSGTCHYYLRNTDPARVKMHAKKPRNCSVCDFCQKTLRDQKKRI